MTNYDIWKTATPQEHDLECCDECNGDDLSECCGARYDEDMGICFDCKEHCGAAGCEDDGCICHATDDSDSTRDDAMRDDELTEK